MRHLFSLLSGAFFLLGIGCSGPDDGRYEIRGTVNFKGAPLDQGGIQYFDKDTNQLAAAGTIADGKYVIPAKQGLKPGTYRVVISSGEPNTKADQGAPGESGPPAKERIPAQYNSNSLKEPVLREVVAGKANQINFDIP